MNSCELDIIKHIKNRINTGEDSSQVIDSIAGEVANNIGDDKDRVKSRLIDLLYNKNTTVNSSPIDDILSLFKVGKFYDSRAYSSVKAIVRSMLINALFNSPNGIATNDDKADINLKSLMKISSQQLSIKNNSKTSKLAFYLYYTKDDSTKRDMINNYELFAKYLIAAHLPTVINAWMSDIITYNNKDDKYSLNIKSQIKKDWNDEIDLKEAKLNSLLKILLENTPMYKFNIDGTVDDDFDSKKHLTQQSFFAAFNKMLDNMDPKDYNSYISNPYYILDYMENKYLNSGAHGTLEDNIIHSFMYTWIVSPYGDSYMYEHFKNDGPSSLEFNPIDIIVRNINKYRINTYIDMKISDKDPNVVDYNVLTLNINDDARLYNRLCDSVSFILKNANNTFFGRFIDINEDGKWLRIKDNVNLTPVYKYLFGNDIEVNSSNKHLFENALNTIIDYYNSNSTNLVDYLKGNDIGIKSIKSILNLVNIYNPYAIRGNIEDASKKSLPTVNLRSVAASIREEVYRLINNNKAYKKIYTDKGKENDINIAPYEHSMMFQQYNNEISRNRRSKNSILINPFIRTVYRSTLTKNIDGVLETKSSGDLSIPEAFDISIYHDFIDNWNKKGDNVVRIQAITPSDKPKIPFFEFSTYRLKELYGRNNRDIEKNVLREYKNIYYQNALNTIHTLNILFDLGINIDYNAANHENGEAILQAIGYINNNLNKTEENVNTALYAYNQNNGTNKMLSKVHDYTIDNNKVVISRYLTSAVEWISQDNPFDELYAQSLKNLPDSIDTSDLLKEDGTLSNEAKNSDLYTYFLMKNILSDNILVNTVGLPLSHKNSGKTFFDMDSKAHLTMVKRMVALTATMHGANENVLSGLSNNINIMTISNDVDNIFTYSGNSSSGKGFNTELKVADGAMFAPRFVDTLTKQSIADTKPKGIDLKLLLHYQEPEHGGAILGKLANFSIDNAMLRTFSDPNIQKVGGIDPEWFIQLSLRNAKFNKDSFNKDGRLVDYNGNEIEFLDYVYYKRWDHDSNSYKIYNVSNVRFYNDTIFYDLQEVVDGELTGEVYQDNMCRNNLFAFWENILGGRYSCDIDGNYNENSQDYLSEILNLVGYKKSDNVTNQNDVDQYLKKQIVHYFSTSEGQKSLQPPIVDIRKAIYDPTKAYTIKAGIQNFGVQLDADHEAEDGNIHEITQLMSFLAERGYVPEYISEVYEGLERLVSILSSKLFINLNDVNDMETLKTFKRKINDVFNEKITFVFTNPNTSTISVANAIVKEIKDISKELSIPYSDNLILGKAHTSVGSYLNKFISRTWNGRGDVLVPSHNMFMIYEDDDGTKFTSGDFKYFVDHEEPVTSYLHNKVWNGEEIRPEYIDTHKVNPYEVMPQDVYYRISSDGYDVVVVNSWDALNNVREDILAGDIYVKAIDLPRNLRSKRVYIDAIQEDGTTTRIGLYHTKTLQEIAYYGNLIDAGENIEINGVVRDVEYLKKEKERLQDRLNNIILPALKNGDINVISEEVPFIENIVGFDYVAFNSERATTNNYSNKFGIPNMNFSEIMQKKENYFREKLVDRFNHLFDGEDLQYDYLLYQATGNPVIVYTKEDSRLNKFIPSNPIVDDEGYKVDANGRKQYKWPNNAKLYSYIIGNKSIDVIVVDNIEDLVSDESFILYRSKYKIRNKSIYDLNSDNLEDLINIIANEQYESWVKSNTAVMARIPSQSLSFAMNIDTVAYLPYGNNIAFVPDEQVFLQGSD